MNERASCTTCVHRRALNNAPPEYSVCHYLLDMGEPRGCLPARCTHWQSVSKGPEQWAKLLRRIREDDAFGK